MSRSPGLERLALVQEDRRGRRVVAEIGSGGREQRDVAVVQHEAALGEADRRRDQRAARARAVLLARIFEARDGSRHGDGEMALGAGPLDDVAGRVEIHVRGRRQRRLFAEVDEGLSPIRELDRHEAAAAQVARRGVDHREGVADGNGRVHGVAAALQHVHAHLGREGMRGHHHAVRSPDGRDGRRLRNRGQQRRQRPDEPATGGCEPAGSHVHLLGSTEDRS